MSKILSRYIGYIRYTWTNNVDPEIETIRCFECNLPVDQGEQSVVTAEIDRAYKAEELLKDQRMVWNLRPIAYQHYPSCIKQ